MEIERNIGSDAGALRAFYGTDKALTREQIAEAGGMRWEDRTDAEGNVTGRVLTLASPFGEGTFAVEFGADLRIDPEAEGDAIDIVELLRKDGVKDAKGEAYTLESWRALTPEERRAVVDAHPDWAKRGGIERVSVGGKTVEGKFLAAVEGRIAIADGAASGDALGMTLFHEQMHGVAQILGDAARGGNAGAAELARALAAKYGAPLAPGEAFNEEAFADAFRDFVAGKIDVAEEERGLFGRFVDFVRSLFSRAEEAARERTLMDEFFEQAAGGRAVEAVAADDAAHHAEGADGAVGASRSSIGERDGMPSAEEVAEARRQYDAVVARYTNPDGTKKPGWMKAPNGADTHLTERQWVQVRTPNFKRWFGDWEAVVELSGSDLVSAKAAFKSLMRDHAEITTSDGATLRFVSQSAKAYSKEAEHESSNRPAHWCAIANIETLVSRAVALYEESPRNGSADIDAYVKYGAVFTLGGRQYLAKITSKRYANRTAQNFYSVESVSVEEITGRGIHGAIGKGQPLDAASEARIAELLARGNPSSVSKVVDENGEPRVVWHGTHWDPFAEEPGKAVFRDAYRGTGSGDNGFFGRGFYFAFTEDEAQTYGRRTGGYFLNLRNPFVFIDEMDFIDGLRTFDMAGSDVAPIVNLSDKFPETASMFTVTGWTFDANGDGTPTELSLHDFAKEIRAILAEPEIREKRDPITEALSEFQKRHGFGSVDIPRITEVSQEPEFTDELKKKGHDGVLQSKDGDEAVAFSPTQIKSATDNAGTFGGERGDIRASIGHLYTGSAADYAERVPVLDKDGNVTGYRIDNAPSLNHVGTGEGSQVYGWGLYASDQRGVAEGYAKTDVSQKRREQMTASMADAKYGRTPKVEFHGAKPAPNSPLERALSFLQGMEMAVDDGIDLLHTRNASIKRKRSFATDMKARMIDDNEKIIQALEQNRDRISSPFPLRPKERLYEQTFFTDRADGEETERHLLKWYEPVTREQMDWIESRLKAEGIGNVNMPFLKGELPNPDNPSGGPANAKIKNGRTVYDHLAYKLGSPQAASEFLARAGIDGVKYPVDSFGGKTVKDGDEAGWNYVSFRDDNIRVDHKWVDGEKRYSIGPRSGVTPAEDAAYMDAVRRGDMETAQRMVREAAKKVFGWTEIAYHGGTVEGEIDHSMLRSDIHGIYANSREEGASKYGDVHALFVPKTFFDFDTFELSESFAWDDVLSAAGKIGLGDVAEEIDRNLKTDEEKFEAFAEELSKEAEAQGDFNGDTFGVSIDGIAMRAVPQAAFAMGTGLIDANKLVKQYHAIGYWDSEISGETYVIDPAYAKSAAPVTYDDAGNVIPLSQRFNTQKEDIRYSIGTKNGVRNGMTLNERRDAIRNLKAIVIRHQNDSSLSVREQYASLENGVNRMDGRTVRFVATALKKILRHKGYDTARIVPQLKEIFDESVPLGFQTERAQATRPDGSVHKEHRNFVGYHNYLGKIADDGREYYVRFTVQEVRTRRSDYVPNELHSTFVSDVELYETAGPLALDTAKGAGKVGASGVDAILAQYLADINGESAPPAPAPQGESAPRSSIGPRDGDGSAPSLSRMDLAVAFAARDAMTGRDRPDEDYARLIRGLGVGAMYTPDELRRAGRAAAATERMRGEGKAGTKAWRAEMRTPSLRALARNARAQRMLEEAIRSAYRFGERAGARAGAKAGTAEAEARRRGEEAARRMLAKMMRSAQGLDVRELDAILGVPAPEMMARISEVLFSGAKAPGQVRERRGDGSAEGGAAPDGEAAPADADTAAPAGESERANYRPDDVLAASRFEAGRLSAMLDAIRDRILALREAEEAKARERARKRAEREAREAEEAKPVGNDDMPEDADEGGGDSGDAGADADSDDVRESEGAEADPDLVRQFLGAMKSGSLDLSTATDFALAVQAFVECSVTRETGVALDAVLKDPVQMVRYRKTMIDFLKATADALLDPGDGASAKWAERRIGDIPDDATRRQLFLAARDILGYVQRNGLNQSRSRMVRGIDRYLKRVAGKAKRLDPLAPDLTRRMTALAVQDARYLRHVLKLTAGGVRREQEALQELIDGRRAQGADEGDAHIDRALRRMTLLEQFGGLRHRMPAEIEVARRYIEEHYEEEVRRMAERVEARRARLGALSDALIKAADGVREALGGTDADAPGTGARVLDALAGGSVAQRLVHLTGDAPEAREAVREIVRMLYEGSTRQRLLERQFRQETDRLLAAAAEAGGISSADLLRQLDEAAPAELSRALATEGQDRNLTWGNVLQLLGSLEQTASYADNIDANGRGDHARIIREAIADRPQFQALMHGLRQLYADRRELLSEASERTTGLPVLSPDPLYLPAVMKRAAREGLDITVKSWTPWSAVFAPRVKNSLDFDTSASILEVLASRSREMAKSVAFAEAGLDLRSVLGRKETQDAFIRARGKHFNTKLIEQVTDALNGGYQTPGNAIIDFLRPLGTVTTYATLSWNVVTMLKQMTSIPAWQAVLDGGYRELWDAFTSFDAQSAREFMDSDGFRSRYGTDAVGFGAFREMVSEALNDPNTPKWQRFHKAGMTLVQLGDFVPSLVVGPGVYKARKAALLRQNPGMTEDAAKRQALSDAWGLIEQCQQSDLQMNLPDIIRRQGIVAKSVMKFANSPLMQVAHEANAFRMWRDAKARGDDEASAKWGRKLAGQLFCNHVLMPAAMYAADLAVKALLGEEPPDRDEWMGQILLEMLTGPLSRVFVVGGMWYSASAWALKRAGLKPSVYSNQNSMGAPVQMLEYVGQDIGCLGADLADLDFESFRDDTLRMIGRGVRPVKYATQAAQNWSGYDPAKARAARRRKARKAED